MNIIEMNRDTTRSAWGCLRRLSEGQGAAPPGPPIALRAVGRDRRNGVGTVLTMLFLMLMMISFSSKGLLAQTAGIGGDGTINKCETKPYTITVLNTSGSDITDLVINNELANLTGFSYVGGTTAITVDGSPVGADCPAVEPTTIGTAIQWDMDSLCSGDFTLAAGSILEIAFSLETDCTADSGSQNVTVSYAEGGDIVRADTITVLPGGVTIKKTPSVVPREVGQQVTWTLYIENTGLGIIENVEVTDALGTGFSYDNSSPAGSNSGQTTTWDSAQIPALASMNPGDIIAIDLTATVIACQGLENNADVKWGCSPSVTCFDTAVDGGTATASVQRIVKTPLISYSPPDITFDYCQGQEAVSFVISNIGDGPAYSVWSLVDFGSLTVSDVSSGATYNDAEKRFELADPIPAGGSYSLSFNLNNSTWCGGTFPTGDLLWQKIYKDGCGNNFYPPVELSQINAPASTTGLTVEKIGSTAIMQIGTQITYTINSTYTGPTSCGSGTAGTVEVKDIIPEGFTVVDSNGGIWNGTERSVTWTYSAASGTMSKTLVLQAPDITQCNTACNRTFTNNVTATVTDCCGCTLTATDEHTVAIECEELVNSNKSATPTSTERCTTIRYRNEYIFDDDPALDSLNLTDLVFTEYAENNQTYAGTPTVTLTGSGDITACVLPTLQDNTPGGGVTIDFSNCTGQGSVRNKTLVIEYDLQINDDTGSACSGFNFYSWSGLQLGTTGIGTGCLSDNTIYEATMVAAIPPTMGVTVTGLGQILDKCESKTITIELTQTSNINPKDVKLVLEGLNYYVTNIGSVVCNGGSVVLGNCTPAVVGQDYVWDFGDLFDSNGKNAILEIPVTKRCTGLGDLRVTAYFDNNCNDDGTSDEQCAVSAVDTPALLLGGDLLIEKNPEVYYADHNQAEWKIYLTNRGTGTARNVYVDDVLGSDLSYVSAEARDKGGALLPDATVNGNQDHTGAAINGGTILITDMTAGERVEITFIAAVNGCLNLTNTVTANWGCDGVDCQSPVTDNSLVEIPAPLLVNTSTVPTAQVENCTTTTGTIVIKNAGQTTNYNLVIDEILPTGLNFKIGSVTWYIDSGAPVAGTDPTITGADHQWTQTQIPGLASLDPGQKITIQYEMTTECPFQGGDIKITTTYENPCGKVFTTDEGKFTVNVNEPVINVTKTRIDDPIGCGTAVEWTITVENASGYNLPVVYVQDVLGAAFTYDNTSDWDAPYAGIASDIDGQTITWELTNLTNGTTATLNLKATSDTPAPLCSSDLDNSIYAWWGCGVVDGDPATRPGTDEAGTCLTTTAENDTHTSTREPEMSILNISMSPLSIDSCNDSTEITIEIQNTGPTDATNLDLEVTLPTGLSYNSTTNPTVTCSGITASAAPPSISGSTLTFYDLGDSGNNICDLVQAAGGNDTLTLKFNVTSDCYATADIDMAIHYYDCCGDNQYSTNSSQSVTATYPDIAITKTPLNSQVDCNGNQTWIIEVTNNGDGNAKSVQIQDIMGPWIEYESSNPVATEITHNTIYQWEINDLAANTSQTFEITGKLVPSTQNKCSPNTRQNTAQVRWGCGTACNSDWTVVDTDSTPHLQMPNLVITNVNPQITCSGSDGSISGAVTVTVKNGGDGSVSGDFTVSVTYGTWTGTGTHTGGLNANQSTDIVIDTDGWTVNCNGCVDYSLDVTVDSGNTVCECNENDNTTTVTASADIPDLVMDSDTLQVNCYNDGSARVSGQITVGNIGCAALNTNIPVRFTVYDNTTCNGTVIDQWTQTISGVDIAASRTQGFTIANRYITTDMVDNSTGCQVSIRVELDYSNTICECDGTNNNTYCTVKNIDIPDLRVTGDTLGVTCLNDGQVRVSGSLTLRNDGCGSNMTTNTPVRFTLYNNTGCGGSVVHQWTETLTGVNIASGGGTQSIAINSTDITTDMVGNSTGCNVSINVEVDPFTTICESDGTNNTWCADNKAINIPDLQVQSEAMNISCISDGQYRVNGQVTLVNNGCGSPLTGSITMQFTLFDDSACSGSQVSQWTQTFTGANIASGGGTQTFTVNNRDITGDIVADSTGCQASIRIVADSDGLICESNGSNNTLCSTETIAVPNLEVVSVNTNISCVSDGNLTGTVVRVTNSGCAPVTGAVVRLTSDCGLTFSDQTVDLSAGQTEDVTFNFASGITNCSCNFTAAIDPGSVICESDGTDNTGTNTAPMTIADIEVTGDTLAVTCNDDGVIRVVGNVTVTNSGCGTALNQDIPMRFTLYDNTGCSGNVLGQWTETLTGVNVNSGGGTQDFTITQELITANLVTNSTGCQVSIFVEADHTGAVCEWDGTNNTYCANNKNVDIPDLQVTGDTLGLNCSGNDGEVTVSGSLTFTNNGCGSNMSDNIPVRFTLYDSSNCTGTAVTTWTETLTGANIAAGGGTQVISITNHTFTTDMVANSANCLYSIRVEADYNDTICESDGTDNTWCAGNKSVDIPNVEFQADTLDFTCTDDGQFDISGTVTMTNTGCGSNLTADIPVRFTLYDNAGGTGNQVSQWTETFTGVNIAANGGTQSFTITAHSLTANLVTNSTGCNVSIVMEADYSGNTICETDGTDNTRVSDKSANMPDLTITGVTTAIECLNDGSLTGTTVAVANNGCTDAVGVVVRLASDCGLTFEDKTVDVPAGESRDVFFIFTSGITACECNFSAVVDPDNTICESDGTNNTGGSTQSMLNPNLEVDAEAVTVSCADDGVIRVSGDVTLGNSGCGPNFTGSVPMRFTLYSRSGCQGSVIHQWTQTFTGADIPALGGSQTFTLQPEQFTADFCASSTNCQVSLQIEADYDNSICEWSGEDNTLCVDKTSDCLDVSATAVAPATNVTADGELNGTMSVTVTNSGGKPLTEDFYVKVDDGKGWTAEKLYNAELGGTLPLAAGASSTVTFQWEREFSIQDCSFDNISTTVDSRDNICQCTLDNDTVTTTYQLEIPNLKPNTITPVCDTDGTYRVEVIVENDGCTDAGPFTVHLEDDRGNKQDATVNGVPAGGTSTVEFTAWVITCEPPTTTFTVTVDSKTTVHEITGTDNTITYTHTDTSPDLVISTVTPSVTCSGPGNLNGKITVTLQNNGNSPVTRDFKVIADDGEGWRSEANYNTELGGKLPIAVGESVFVTINWNRGFTKEPFKCDFNAINVGLDLETSLCECAAGNNETVTTYSLPFPDLGITALLPQCSQDGQRKFEMTVGNNGCEDMKEDFNITVSDSTGHSKTAAFTSMGGTLPLKSGQPQTLLLAEWDFDCTTGGTIAYTATIMADAKSCDLNAANNSITVSEYEEVPDVTFGEIDWDCNTNGSINFTVQVVNQGNGDALNVPVNVYDNDGKNIFNQTVDLTKGTSATLTFGTDSYPQNNDLTFRFVVDEDLQVCECDGDNNEKLLTVKCTGGGEEEPLLKLTSLCPPGQQQGGLFRFELQIKNTGETPLYNVIVKNFLPEGFQYVAGTTTLDGQQITDPQTDNYLTWNLGTLASGGSFTLLFSAVADADMEPGQYCADAESSASASSGSTSNTIKSDRVQCCTTVTRKETGGGGTSGCCLKVEEWPMAPYRRPDSSMSYIEPYFHTETAMYTAYTAFTLWKGKNLSKGSMPRFMQERMKNYARSTVEEFYLDSHMGATMPDGTLWLSYAGAYPEHKDKDLVQVGWARKQVDETMTVSQVAFELLALKEAVNAADQPETAAKLRAVIGQKLAFIAKYLDDAQESQQLPHGWEIKQKKTGEEIDVEKDVKKLEAKATLYDQTSLYLSMVELSNDGYANTPAYAKTLRRMLKNIDDTNFDGNNLREEFLFIKALHSAGQNGQAAAKFKKFEKRLAAKNAKGREGEQDGSDVTLDGLHDYAMAIYLSRAVGGSVHEQLQKEMQDRFYMKDTGIYAEKQPDLTFKLNLHSLAPVLLAIDEDPEEQREQDATILYRTFDEVGMFLKKRNLMVGKPLYSLLKNYPFAEPMMPLLSFTKANRSIAPVFSRDAVVHSTQTSPLGEIEIPQTFTRILSPSYETHSSRIASVSFGLQYAGRLLKAQSERVIKEEGRSFDETGQKYVDSLLKSGAGIQVDGNVVVPFDVIAVKGPKQGEYNLEPLNSGTLFSTEALANYMLAEKYYLEGNGIHAEAVKKVMTLQTGIVEQFKTNGFVPKTFHLLIDENTGEMTITPSEERASKLTAAKLYFLLPKDKNFKFLAKALKKSDGQLLPEDLIFFSAAPETVQFFEKEIKAVVDAKDSKISYNAADILGRKLLNQGADAIADSIANLKKHWDKDAVMPTSDNIETIEKGLIYNHDPQQFVLYLLATRNGKRQDFRFKRTLDFFTYMLESEWGMEWDNANITLPSQSYQVFRENPRERFEPGDVINFKVRVENTCPDGTIKGTDLPALYLKAEFTPQLIHTGTQQVQRLNVLGDFQWGYEGFPQGSVLEYIYQAVIPQDFKFNFIDGWILASGRQGLQDFGPGTGTGDQCDDIHNIRKISIVPLQELQGLVFEDKNVNGIKDVGEPGVPNIRFKDTRGRIFRSDAQGRFTVMAGDEHEGIQVELKSIPPNYLLITEPTRLVNRYYTGDIHFGLISCETVTGFVYVDENQNGQYDAGETKPSNIVLKAKDKEVVTGSAGSFMFRNLPVLWQQWIEIKKSQPYYKGNIQALKFQLQK